MKFNNCEIWGSSSCLYIRTPKDILVKLSGEDVSKIKLVVESILSKEPNINSSLLIDSDVKEVLMLLDKMGVIQDNKKEEDVIQYKIGIYSDESMLKELKTRMPNFNIEIIHDFEKLNNYSLILILSPFFKDYITLSKIGYKSYQEQVPLLFCEFSAMSFTIGPLVLPKKHTPSLNCYLKRRMVNSKSPELFAEMITQYSEPLLKPKFQDFYYHDIYLTLICEEISKFLKLDGSYSKHLIGMSITTNFVTYEIEKSKILKDPMSKLFTRTPFTPFNG